MLGAALFDKPAFKNLIVNGLVLASDGKKMSKRLKNYPGEADLIDRRAAWSRFLCVFQSVRRFISCVRVLILSTGRRAVFINRGDPLSTVAYHQSLGDSGQNRARGVWCVRPVGSWRGR